MNLDQKNFKNECVWQLMPWDNHPNKDANKIFAGKILELIKFQDENNQIFQPIFSEKDKDDDPQKYIYSLW